MKKIQIILCGTRRTNSKCKCLHLKRRIALIQDKADLFAEYLGDTFQPLPRHTADENIKSIPKLNDFDIRTVTLNELKEEVKSNMNVIKVPDYDLIICQTIKALPDKALRKQ